MKKIVILMFFIMAILLTYQFVKQPQSIKKQNIEKFLTYSTSTPEDLMISLSVFDSEQMKNQVVMTNVVGTLVKYSGIARYENYLVDRWTTSEDKKKWTFEFKENLKDETGETLSAVGYVENLKKLLAIYKKNYIPPCFEMLKGWKNFKTKEDNLVGLYADGKNVVMEFDGVPSGLLEFLSMPYYGYYSSKDFSDEKWKDTDKIISTGQYSVQKLTNGDFILSSRGSNAPLGQRGLEKIKITYLKDNELENVQSLFSDVSERSTKEYKNFLELRSTPSLLRGMILSPFVGVFKEKDARRIFNDEFTRVKKAELNSDFSEDSSEEFYKIFEGLQKRSEEKPIQDVSSKEILKNKEISVFFRQNANKYNDEMLRLLKKTASNLGMKLKLVSQDDLKNYDRLSVYSNKMFDIRLFGVDIGGAPENWVTEMMFRSNLGVTFPDVDGNWKNHVEKYNSNYFKSDLEYWMDFQKIIKDDLTVIPVFQSGLRWIYSKNIKGEMFSQTMNLPRFDEIILED